MQAVEFNPADHSYTMGGLPLIGVTKFISAVLAKGKVENWHLSNIPAVILEKAAKRGTDIHNAVELWCNGFDSDDEYVSKAKELLSEYTEYKTEYLISDECMFASSIDILAYKSDGTIAIIDIKTNSKMGDAEMEQYTWQLSIYKYMYKNVAHECKILWLPKDLKSAKMIDIEPKSQKDVEYFLYDAKNWVYYHEFIKNKRK